MDVFEETPPHAVYVPNGSDWSATATTACTLAVCTAPGQRRPRRAGASARPASTATDPRQGREHPPHPPDRHGGARRRRLAPRHRGLHARRQLVVLPAAPARRGRLPADDLPRGDLLPPAEPGPGLRLPARLHRGRQPRRDHGRRATTTSCWCRGATTPAAPPTATTCTTSTSWPARCRKWRFVPAPEVAWIMERDA